MRHNTTAAGERPLSDARPAGILDRLLSLPASALLRIGG